MEKLQVEAKVRIKFFYKFNEVYSEKSSDTSIFKFKSVYLTHWLQILTLY